jgi:hypothetical protein
MKYYKLKIDRYSVIFIISVIFILQDNILVLNTYNKESKRRKHFYCEEKK